ncbi:hypothetical protein BDZ97DRAFT_1890559, partial [Flammula alnicola]
TYADEFTDRWRVPRMPRVHVTLDLQGHVCAARLHQRGGQRALDALALGRTDGLPWDRRITD